jgi:uncharacterized membrane protein (DUF373 family)
MEDLSTQGKIIRKIEVVTVRALQVLLILIVVIATIILFVLFLSKLRDQAGHIDSVDMLLPVMQRSFAGILTVVLGLELLETLKAYFAEHHIRLEVILIVAIIAAGRHVLEIDFDHTSGIDLLGFSGIIVSLTLGYFLVKRAHDEAVPGGNGCESHDES